MHWTYKAFRGSNNLPTLRSSGGRYGPCVLEDGTSLFFSTPDIRGDYVRSEEDIMVVGTKAEVREYSDLIKSMQDDSNYRYCGTTAGFWPTFFGNVDKDFLDISVEQRRIPKKILATGNIRNLDWNGITETLFGVEKRIEEIAEEFDVGYSNLEPTAI